MRCPYPLLRELTAAEIPVAPTPPADIALVAPVSVVNAAGLQAMQGGHDYSIDADIDLAGVTWTPLNFNSATLTVIEGNDHTISNLTLSSAFGLFKGFIATITGTGPTQVRNLKFANCSVSAATNVAICCAYIGSAAPNVHIKNVSVTDSSITVSSAKGGIVIGSIDGNAAYVSGCTVTDCTITGGNNNTQNLGGMIGALYEQSADTVTNIVNCTVSGGTMNIAAERTYRCGGFIGEAYTSPTSEERNHGFYNCSTSMDIIYIGAASGTAFIVQGIGGFIGNEINTIAVSCHATGNLTFTTDGTWTFADEFTAIGGYVGDSSCWETLIDCYATGTITFEDAGDTPKITNVGGFGGFCDYDVQMLRCYSTGNLVFKTDISQLCYIGGFISETRSAAGYATGTLSRCWSEGDITFDGNITTALLATGGTNQGRGLVGGFIGWMGVDATVGIHIEDCYAWGSVILNGTHPANLTVSGFAGAWKLDIADIVINRCYCAQTDSKWGSGYTGQLPSDVDSHGFGGGAGSYGTSLMTGTEIYYDSETSGLNTSPIGIGKTTSWLQTKTNFTDAGWDFDTIWTMECEGAAYHGQVIHVQDFCG